MAVRDPAWKKSGKPLDMGSSNEYRHRPSIRIYEGIRDYMNDKPAYLRAQIGNPGGRATQQKILRSQKMVASR